MLIRILKWLVGVVTIVGIASGCSLAVDTQQQVSIPIRKDGFELNAPAIDRLKDVADKYQPSLGE